MLVKFIFLSKVSLIGYMGDSTRDVRLNVSHIISIENYDANCIIRTSQFSQAYKSKESCDSIAQKIEEVSK